MRKTGTVCDSQRRKKTIRQAGMDMNPKHWPTALVVCPNSLVRNVSYRMGTRIGVKTISGSAS